MPIIPYYSSNQITNGGELRVERMLRDELDYEKETYYVIYPFLVNRHVTQLMGEFDFVIVTRYGIVVMEVKGSQVKYDQNTFYQKQGNDFQKAKDPFIQVRDNMRSLIEILRTKREFNDVAITTAVVFPESDYTIRFPDNSMHYWSKGMKHALSDYVKQQEQELKSIMESRGWSPLNRTRQELLAKFLIPNVVPHVLRSLFDITAEQARKRAESNSVILQGLTANRRILIQGPPGSGKSTYAMDMMQLKYSSGANTILYLCFNELLPVYVQYKVMEKGMTEGVTCSALYPFVLGMMSDAGMNTSLLPPESLNEPGRLKSYFNEACDLLQSMNRLPQYDYIVLDEAQDMFHLGVDDVVNRLSAGTDDGLKKGNYLVFYDIRQAFRKRHDVEDYTLTLEIFKEYAAIYNLYDRYRGVAGDGLYDFVADIQNSRVDFKKHYGADVVIDTYTNKQECISKLQKTVNKLRTETQYDPTKIVVLFSSNLSSALYKRDRKELDDVLENNTDFLSIDKENLTVPHKNAIKYTTALTYKGLERDIVVLVVKDVYNPQIDGLYQLLIGASRARVRLYVLVDNESVAFSVDQHAESVV